jgi:hypothetical protein
MAKKRIDIDLGVNTSELDSAAQKVGELRKLSDNLSIQYDIDGKPLDVVINKSLNLQKQVRVLTAELRKTKEGTAEFQVLSRALGDANDQLAKSNAKSKDLFGSLSLLPGPVGQFASQIGGAIDLLKVFSSFSLKDIQFQLKETGNDIVDIAKGFLGLNSSASEVTNVTNQAANATENLSDNLVNVTSGAAATSGAIKNVSAQTEALNTNFLNSTLNSRNLRDALYNLNQSGFDAQIDILDDLNGKVKEQVISVVDLDGSIKVLTVDQIKAAAATKGMIGSIDGLVLSEKAATFWTTTLGKTIQGVLIGTGIGIAIVVIGELISLIYKWVTSTEDADKANKALTETMKEQQRVLENDQQAIELSIRLNVARAKAAGKTEQEIFEITKKGGQDKLDLLRYYDKQLYEDQKKITKNTKLNEEDRMKLLEEVNGKILKNGQDITKQIIENEISYYDNLASLRNKNKGKVDKDSEDTYNRKLKELDALIQLEIDKDNTRRKELQTLLDKRRKMVTDHDKLTFAEQELMRNQNAKKVQDALDEDSKRLQAYQSKVDDVRIAAIEDEEQRQLQARAKKLYDDKVALTYDLEFQKRSKQEQDAILKQMEEATAMDLLKIRDGFYMKKFQKDEEAFLKEMELQTRVKEFELANGQTRLDQANDFNTLYGDYIFGNKGLKEQWKKYFVDLRQVYQDEYFYTDYRLAQEKEQLQKDFDEKKLTRESYEQQIIQINDRIIANRERNTQRQLDLDKLEIDSKRANADMTIQVGERLVSALSAIAGKNKKLQKAAALVEAGVAIARIVTDTSRAIIAFSASVAPLGPAGVPIAAAYAVKAKIAGALGIATIIAQGIGKLKSIDDSDSGATEGGGGQQGNGLGRGYAQGGLIKGRRHAQGGTLIEAEDGEAVMTRGAVTMFAPLLSAMNQMGGGTSFSNMNVVRPDNPVLSNPAQQQAPLIVKTYVVENELSSTQAKQARLKDLSTL